ncbi:MAG: bifunctional 4-hydroxy-2-oxoglutarate aldolase/2-dehydro-3-deoxy-phosphogluconate aldolase [Planctomycetaceae bacterium]|nr:bifunctional 4-hydroxy-2-oxoglutarate aldolase/2-dehydro-3-deoxy-phosphogluconate aldolase [Planctomycetaceae bacterium]
MSRASDLQRLLSTGIVAILRAPSAEQLGSVARALHAGGIDVIEVTFTTPNAAAVIQEVQRDLGDKVLLGAGTILDPETARTAILAGAEFLVSPAVNVDVIRLAHRYDKLMLPGAYTPTEVITAWEAGADVIKLFPAEIGGAPYLKALRGPLPQVRFLPTGGVNLQTLPAFFEAGACAVGLGSQLVDPAALQRGDFRVIEQSARQYVELVKATRQRLAAAG